MRILWTTFTLMFLSNSLLGASSLESEGQEKEISEKKINILFLCTGNSCRSQMAEGWGKSLKGDQFNFYSAGTKPHNLNQRAIQVMAEAGVDISHHRSKTTSEIPEKMDIVFTVCSNARDNCPYFPEGKIIHAGFEDPPQSTNGMEDAEQILGVYRIVRDQIRDFVLDIESFVGHD